MARNNRTFTIALALVVLLAGLGAATGSAVAAQDASLTTTEQIGSFSDSTATLDDGLIGTDDACTGPTSPNEPFCDSDGS